MFEANSLEKTKLNNKVKDKKEDFIKTEDI